MRKQQNTNSLTSAELHQGAVGCSCSIHFLCDTKHLSVVGKYPFADILSKAA